jgi:DNA-binding response OmpR family regulator
MTQPRKILIAGASALRDGLAEQFALHREFSLLQADSAESARRLSLTENPDALLIDDDLPPPGSQALVAAVRAAGFRGGVILLAASARANAPGVDDIVIRPFRFAGLLERIRARLHARDAARSGVIAIGPYVFRLEQHELIDAEGARVALTEKEAALLARLVRAKGAVAPRDVLLRDVWGYGPSVATRTLETHIHRLRRKIEADPARPSLLVTERGGYRLTAWKAIRGVKADYGARRLFMLPIL